MAQDGCCFQLGQLAAKLSSAVPGAALQPSDEVALPRVGLGHGRP